MSFSIDDEKLLEEYKAIWAKIEDLKTIKLNALPVYDYVYLYIFIYKYIYIYIHIYIYIYITYIIYYIYIYKYV